MRITGVILAAALIALSQPLFAQTQDYSRDAAKREALLKEFVAQDRGDITTLEPSTLDNGDVYIGYEMGALWVCRADLSCKEFAGTPKAPVRRIAASRNGNTEIVWVAYRQGALYRCEKSVCTKSTTGDSRQ